MMGIFFSTSKLHVQSSYMGCILGLDFDHCISFHTITMPHSGTRPDFTLINLLLIFGLDLKQSMVKMPLHFKDIKLRARIVQRG